MINICGASTHVTARNTINIHLKQPYNLGKVKYDKKVILIDIFFAIAYIYEKSYRSKGGI